MILLRKGGDQKESLSLTTTGNPFVTWEERKHFKGNLHVGIDTFSNVNPLWVYCFHIKLTSQDLSLQAG